MPFYGNYNDGIMPFTKKVVCRFQKKKYKLKSNETIIPMCSWIYQWCDAFCIIRRYYCLNRDEIERRRECISTRNSPLMLQNASNEPKSTLKLGCMCPSCAELCPRHDVVTISSISSISYRYGLFYVDIVHTFLLSILRRHRFDIVTISSCNCLIKCIVVDIDKISSCSSWIKCLAVDIVDIIDIDSISIQYRVMIVGLAVLLSISSI